METGWLEDFLALADSANFSRAAELRNLTQPAFSRRIRALEDWVGVNLFTRDTRRTELTGAGNEFRPRAEEVLRLLRQAREEARQTDERETASLHFGATHALALTFFPAWLREFQADARYSSVTIVANSMENCETMMLQGRLQYLLCYYHAAAPTRLSTPQFRSHCLGQDWLVPVSAPEAPGRARHGLPGSKDAPLPYLSYGHSSGMGRILDARRGSDDREVWLRPVLTSHAIVLRSMAREGRGLAWSPRTLVAEDLKAGRLVRAGNESWDIPVEVRLFRQQARQHPLAESFWSSVVQGDVATPSEWWSGEPGMQQV